MNDADTKNDLQSSTWRAYEQLGVARRLVIQAAKAVCESPTADALATLSAMVSLEEVAREHFKEAARGKEDPRPVLADSI